PAARARRRRRPGRGRATSRERGRTGSRPRGGRPAGPARRASPPPRAHAAASPAADACSFSSADPPERPRGMLALDVVALACDAVEQRSMLRAADVAERDEGVAPQPAWLVARHEQPVVALDELAAVLLEPPDEIDVPGGRLGL